MAIFDKLKFWKKKEDADLGDLGDLGALPPLPGEPGGERDYGMPGFGADTGGFYPNRPSTPQTPPPRQEPPQPSFAPITPQQYRVISPPQPMPVDTGSRDIEIISVKLDSIRMSLETINQRLANIERIAYGEQERVQIRRQW